ncbi:MAG: type II toxin-antitoxin system RelE/ParE family toxin [Nitrospiraceae bacterium]|nr:type II toxin-antitoxin system RelE/ParE family toxin [Nitrospiraceae bacterium]
MAYKIEFIPEAGKDFEALDMSLKKDAGKKIDALSINPFLGKPLGNKLGIDLTGLYKLYFHKKRYRIVYRIMEERVEVLEIIGIGKRDKEEIYRLVAKRVKRLLKP